MDEPIGRQQQCRVLDGFLADLAEGRGGVLLLEGEGGTGKTTLAQWAGVRAERRGFTVLTGRSWELSQSVPYEPVVGALGRFLRSLPVAERVDLTHGLTSLASLIDGLDLGGPIPSATSESSRVRLHDAVATLLARVAERGPVLFQLDDLHWADSSSLEVLQFLCRDLPYVALGILATVRPFDADERPDVRSFLAPLRRAPFSTSVAVQNLDHAETELLIRTRLGGEPPDRLLELLWSRSIGTPLVVHEMIEDLIARNVLRLDGSRWSLTDPDPPLPRAVADLIRDRIDRVRPDERELLEIMAIADEPTRLETLASVSSLESDAIEKALRRLIGLRLVAQSVSSGSAEVSWHADHPIISQVVVDGLDELVRQRLHRKLLLSDPRAPLARRARHVIGGGPPHDPLMAAELMVGAADEALGQGAAGQAVVNFRAARALLSAHRDVPEPNGDDGLLDDLDFRIELGLGTALTRSNHYDEAISILEALLRRVGPVGSRRRLDVLRILDRAVFVSGRGTETVAPHIRSLRRAFEAAGDWDMVAEVIQFEVLANGRDGMPDATEAGAEAVAHLRAIPLGRRAKDALRLLEWNEMIFSGDPAPLRPIADQLLAMATSGSDWEVRRRASLFAFDIAGYLGLPELVTHAMAVTRALEAETGEGLNWRVPVLRALDRVSTGEDPEELGLLRQIGAVERTDVLIALIRGIDTRYRSGPAVAIEQFEAQCVDLPGRDRVAGVFTAQARVLLTEGMPNAVVHAEALVQALGDRSRRDPSIPGILAYSLPLALTVLDDHARARRLVAEYQLVSEHRGLPSAWSELALARMAATAPDRAGHLLAAADLLDECNDPLAAAARRIEAAETDARSVPSETLRAALVSARQCRAHWLVERANRVAPSLTLTDSDPGIGGLTKREREVSAEVAKGLTNREIAQELFISIRTVTSHLDHIYTKLGITSRSELSGYVLSETESST